MLEPMARRRCPPALPAPTPYLARRCPDCGLRDMLPRSASDPDDAVAVVLACTGCDPEPHTIIRWLDLRGEDCT
jgi:hypothetical protein